MTHQPKIFTVEPYPADGSEPVYCCIPDAPLRVLKFGSSVLRTAADLPRVAGEIYRQRRAGKRMIVIVSALAGETDELFALAREAGGGDPEGVADLVSLGEEKTAALLRIACARLGLDARIVRPEELGIHTTGAPLDADPASINLPALSRLASRHDLLIMPGFVGIHEDGRRSLLGRGGSDFTAIFIGGEIGAECVRLYKDVDGVFDHDPASEAGEARKFSEVSWSDCLELARPLLQPRSVEYAEAKSVLLEVEAVGSNAPTRVGPVTRPPTLPVGERRLRVALAGFGAVGQAVHARLRDEPRFEIVSILVRDPQKPRSAEAPAFITNSAEAFLAADADIFIDAISDACAALALGQHFLARGCHAVTASKRLITDHRGELRSAATREAQLRHSASVGGGVPILETVALARRHGEIKELQGVLNGTMNFVLGALASGTSLEDAIAQARVAGLAEEDPSDDLLGHDVRSKLRILAAASFGTANPELEIEPMDAALAERVGASGEPWVQLATLRREGQSVRGGARYVPAGLAPYIPALRREQNYVAVRGACGRRWVSSGFGAGGLPTAEAIVADLYDISRQPSLSDLPRPLVAAR